MSLYTSQLRDQMTAAVDGVFAQEVLLRFWKGGREDAARPSVQINAPLIVHSRETNNLSGGRSENWKTDVRAGGAELRIDRTKYPDVEIGEGDTVQALELPGTPTFEVISVDTRSAVRLIVELGDK